jgi:hypothetical protein
LARTGGTALVSCSIGSLLLFGGVLLAAPARTLHTVQERAVPPTVALLAWTLLLRSRRLADQLLIRSTLLPLATTGCSRAVVGLTLLPLSTTG